MNKPSIHLIQELEKIFDFSAIIYEEEKLNDYREDMGGFKAEPLAVVRPSSEAEIIRLIEFANQWHVPIVPRGAGTSLTGAVVLSNAIILDMSSFDKILKIDKINWYVSVQSGVVLDDLNDELGKQGFFFPPDPASSFACTVGGAISEGSGGMRCVRYGTMKDWVLSVRVILPSGNVANLGEPLYKNRAGYDLTHLIVGSEGTLGVVTQACLKIIPIPRVLSSRILAYFPDWSKAGQSIKSIRESRISPLLLEFMDRETILAVNRDIEKKLDDAESVLLIDVESVETDHVIDMLRKNGAINIRVAQDAKEAEEIYQARAIAYLSLKSLASGVQIEDVVVPIDELAGFLESLKGIGTKFGVKMAVMGHAGDGNVHPVILYDENDESQKTSANRAIEELCRTAIRIGGSITGEHGVGIQKVDLFSEQLVHHNGEEALQLMKGVKRLFDKNSIMNPKKYVEAA